MKKNLNPGETKVFNKFIKTIPEISSVFLSPKKKTSTDILNIIIINDEKMNEINLSFRKIDKTTDVITFEFEKNLPSDSGPGTAEIYISGEKALAQSKEHNLTLLNEYIILVVHGLVHAFGYDHEKSESENLKMKKIETNILEYLEIKDIQPLTN